MRICREGHFWQFNRNEIKVESEAINSEHSVFWVDKRWFELWFQFHATIRSTIVHNLLNAPIDVWIRGKIPWKRSNVNIANIETGKKCVLAKDVHRNGKKMIEIQTWITHAEWQREKDSQSMKEREREKVTGWLTSNGKKLMWIVQMARLSWNASQASTP